MKKIIVLMLVFSGSAMASTKKTVQIDVYPYIGTLGSSAIEVEEELSDKIKSACGSLENVEDIEETHLEMKSPSVSKLNEVGSPGDGPYSAIFTFAYPRVVGEVVVLCKD